MFGMFFSIVRITNVGALGGICMICVPRDNVPRMGLGDVVLMHNAPGTIQVILSHGIFDLCTIDRVLTYNTPTVSR